MAQGPLMKCGCVAVAKDEDGNWVCPAHSGLDCGANEIEDAEIDLKGREAECACGRREDSSLNLPFFRYRPNEEYDVFYCGCKGWA